MDIKNKNIKSPKELFEERRLQSLEEFEYQKTKEIEKQLIEIQNKKILSPKIYFNEVPLEEENFGIDNEYSIENDYEEIDLYQEQISSLKLKLESIENSIPKKVDLSEIFDLIDRLENKIDNLPKQKDYSTDIDFIKNDLDRIEKNIPLKESFDPSDLYENISILRNKIEEVRSEIPEIPEQVLYDDQLEELKQIVQNVYDSIPVIPEIKCYENEINQIIESIDSVQNQIAKLPEIKYYDSQIFEVEKRLEEIQGSIPDVKYYDEDLEDLKTKIDEVKTSIPDVKYYDEEIQILNNEVKDLYLQLTSIEIPEKNVYLEEIKSFCSSFDEQNKKLVEKINYLEEIFEKFNDEKALKENLSEPPQTKNDDPLTPLDQKFVTLNELQEHYRLFVNRVQQQLSTIGGGGETRLEFLDDVDRKSAKTNGYILKYDSTVGKFIGTSYVSDSSGIGSNTSINTTGIITASSFYGDGSNLTGVIATGSGVEVKDNNVLVGTASTLNFGPDLDVSFSSGVATINVSIPLSAITDVDTSNLSGISTDYLMVYDPNIPGFKFVDPKTYFGINNDANPSPDIDDYGSY